MNFAVSSFDTTSLVTGSNRVNSQPIATMPVHRHRIHTRFKIAVLCIWRHTNLVIYASSLEEHSLPKCKFLNKQVVYLKRARNFREWRSIKPCENNWQRYKIILRFDRILHTFRNGLRPDCRTHDDVFTKKKRTSNSNGEKDRKSHPVNQKLADVTEPILRCSDFQQRIYSDHGCFWLCYRGRSWSMWNRKWEIPIAHA